MKKSGDRNEKHVKPKNTGRGKSLFSSITSTCPVRKLQLSMKSITERSCERRP